MKRLFTDFPLDSLKEYRSKKANCYANTCFAQGGGRRRERAKKKLGRPGAPKVVLKTLPVRRAIWDYLSPATLQECFEFMNIP